MGLSPSYASTPELAAYLRVGDNDDDVQLGLALTAASRAIDRTCKRQFGLADSVQTRIYTPRIGPDARYLVDIDDVMSSVGMSVEVDFTGDGTFASTLTAYTVNPVNAEFDEKPWTQLATQTGLPLVANSVRVTAQWGWTSVPDTVKQACLLQASRFHARRNSPFGISGSPQAGGELRLLAKVDVDVAVVLRPYTRRWFAL